MFGEALGKLLALNDVGREIQSTCTVSRHSGTSDSVHRARNYECTVKTWKTWKSDFPLLGFGSGNFFFFLLLFLFNLFLFCVSPPFRLGVGSKSSEKWDQRLNIGFAIGDSDPPAELPS